ncbi:putative mitochondrial protein [Tanacetum coccineum]
MATCHPVIGATWPVNSPGAVTGATTGPPVNGGQRRWSTMVNHHQTTSQRRSTVVVKDGQRWRTTVDRRRTTGQRLGLDWVGSLIGSVRHVACHVDPRVSHVCPRGFHVDADVDINCAIGIVVIIYGDLPSSEHQSDTLVIIVKMEILPEPTSNKLCGRLVIPRHSPWIPKLFHEFHNSVVGGHSGALKTQRRMAKEVYWVGMKKDVEKLVAECDICQRQKYSTMAPNGLLQPLNLPTRVWAEITMDFIDGLPKSEGYTVILVVVDRLSKYAHFVPLRHPYTAKTVATAFLREVVRLHGIPESIVSDRDRVFLSHFWRELFKLQGTNLKRSSSYHPQTDGQSEVVNRSVETYLRCFASDTPKQWARWISWTEYWYNTSYHTSMNMTPFKVLYGRDPPHLIYYASVPSPVFEVDRYLEERDCILKELKEHLLRAQERMKKQAEAELRVDALQYPGFRSDIDDMKSLTGYLHKLNYIAASEAEKECVWIRKFILGLGIVPTINEPIKMFCDNSAALHFANEPGVQKGTRHYHRSNLLKVHTDNNLAYPFTKALPKGKLTQHARSMGLRLVSIFM